MAGMLEICRDALRRSTHALDETELRPLIEAAKLELSAAGAVTVDDTDPLVQAAIRLYVLGTVERDEKLLNHWEQTKRGIALNGRYRGGTDDAAPLG